MRRDRCFEFCDQKRNPFLSPTPMSDGIFNLRFGRRGSISEKDLHRITDRALLGIEVAARVAFILLHDHFRAQSIDPRIFGHRVFIVVRGQCAEDQANGRHVLKAMIAIGSRKGNRT